MTALTQCTLTLEAAVWSEDAFKCRGLSRWHKGTRSLVTSWLYEHYHSPQVVLSIRLQWVNDLPNIHFLSVLLMTFHLPLLLKILTFKPCGMMNICDHFYCHNYLFGIYQFCHSVPLHLCHFKSPEFSVYEVV